MPLLFRYVLVIFMEKDTENEANILELTKKFKQVKFLQVWYTITDKPIVDHSTAPCAIAMH